MTTTNRFILTGAPGAGKTVLIRQLERQGHSVVEEAATDVIALEQALGIEESWRDPGFTETIARLQVQRMSSAPHVPGPQFHDRSLFCTYALARYLGHPVPPLLEAAAGRAIAEEAFARRVFFVGLLGFVTPTAARRINLEDATRFEAVHEQTYRDFGFELFPIPPGTVAGRTAAIIAAAAECAPQI